MLQTGSRHLFESPVGDTEQVAVVLPLKSRGQPPQQTLSLFNHIAPLFFPGSILLANDVLGHCFSSIGH